MRHLMLDPAVRSLPWRDLRAVSASQAARNLLLSPPWLVLSLYLAGRGWYLPALPASFIFFMAGLRQSHDAFHHTLGLPRRATDAFLFALSACMAVPLHAVRHNHLHHHARPLEDDDVEGMCARLPGWLAVAMGPIFTVRMLAHAARKMRGAPLAWAAAEALAVAALATTACRAHCPVLSYHLLVMAAGNCLTGFFAVWLVHHDCEPAGIFARTQRGRFVNALTLHLFYHLEHHLFPAVPAARLPTLARRLDKVLAAARSFPVVGGGKGPRMDTDGHG